MTDIEKKIIDFDLHWEITIEISNIKFDFIVYKKGVLKNIISPVFHSHSWFEIFLVIDGDFSIKTDKQSYSLSKNDLALITPNTYHSTSWNGEGVSLYNICFSCTRIKSAVDEGFYNAFKNVLRNTDFYLLKNQCNIKDIIVKYHEALSSAKIAKRERLKVYLSEFVLSLYDELEKNIISNSALLSAHKSEKLDELKQEEQKIFIKKNKGEAVNKKRKSSKYDNILKDISSNYIYKIDMITSNYSMNELSLKALADMLFLSTKQVSRIIKKEYNQTFSQKMISNKIENAKKLILENEKDIKEISLLVGYSSVNGFYNAFKKIEGITPAQYREKYNKNIDKV